jgi:hypothetical protein
MPVQTEQILVQIRDFKVVEADRDCFAAAGPTEVVGGGKMVFVGQGRGFGLRRCFRLGWRSSGERSLEHESESMCARRCGRGGVGVYRGGCGW